MPKCQGKKKVIEPWFYSVFAPRVCVCVYGREFWGVTPAPKHRGNPFPWLCCPSAACLSFPSSPSVRDPPHPLWGKSQGYVMGTRSCPRFPGSLVPGIMPAGMAQGGSAARENLLLPFRASKHISCRELPLLGCPPKGSHTPRAGCPRLRAGFWGTGRQRVLQQDCAAACFPPLHRAGEGESGRKREGKDVSNQSYLNKSLFGPRALLKAAYLIKSPIFHIYGPYSVKY